VSISFVTNKNYMKHALRGETTMDKPDTLSGGFYTSSKTISHSLGYRPLVRAYFDIDSDGTWYPPNGQRDTQTTGATSMPFWFFVDSITTSAFTLRAESFSEESGTMPVHYIVYRDFE